jgi:hypothetical protein
LLPSPDALDALRATLTRRAVEAGELDQSIEWGEVGLDVDVPAGMRRRIGKDLHTLKTEMLHVRRCPPFGPLAERVNEAAGLPVVDGLGLAGLAFVLGTRPELLAEVSTMLQQLRT